MRQAPSRRRVLTTIFLRRARVAAGIVAVGGAALALVPGCLITGTPDFTPPAGIMVSGSCMCAFCLDKPFCMDAAKTSTLLGPLCDAEHPLQAVDASQVDSLSGRKSLFCIPDDPSLNVDWTGPDPEHVTCPADAAERAAIEHLGCQDVPVRCLSGAEQIACNRFPTPDDPGCPSGNSGPQRSACGDDMKDPTSQTGMVNSVNLLIDKCSSIWGSDIPNGTEAKRYCFTSCIDESLWEAPCAIDCNIHPFTESCEVESCPAFCDPEVIHSPEVSMASLVASIDPHESRAHIVVTLDGQDFVTDVEIGGTVALDFTQDCWGLPGQESGCDASVPMLHLATTAPFEISEAKVLGASLINVNPIPGATTTSEGRNVLTLQSEEPMYLVANIDGTLQQAIFRPAAPLTGVVAWETRTFDLSAFLEVPGGNAVMELVLHGTLPYLGPHADAGPDQRLECTSPAGTPAMLSADRTTDPDGPMDMNSFVWTGHPHDTDWTLGGEVVTTPPVPVGTTHFGLQVTDRSGTSSFASTNVIVEDTIPPTFDSIALATTCLGPPDDRMRLFRLGQELLAPASDTCDATPYVRIVNVVSDQPATGDIAFGTGAVCIRDTTLQGTRTYTITLEVTDAHANASRTTVTVEVPDQGAGCTTGGDAPAVADNDPRCTTVAVDPHGQ